MKLERKLITLDLTSDLNYHIEGADILISKSEGEDRSLRIVSLHSYQGKKVTLDDVERYIDFEHAKVNKFNQGVWRGIEAVGDDIRWGMYTGNCMVIATLEGNEKDLFYDLCCDLLYQRMSAN